MSRRRRKLGVGLCIALLVLLDLAVFLIIVSNVVVPPGASYPAPSPGVLVPQGLACLDLLGPADVGLRHGLLLLQVQSCYQSK